MHGQEKGIIYGIIYRAFKYQLVISSFEISLGCYLYVCFGWKSHCYE